MDILFFKVYRNVYLKRKIHSYIKHIINNNKYAFFNTICYNYELYIIMYNNILTKKDIIYLLCNNFFYILMRKSYVVEIYNITTYSEAYDIILQLYKQGDIIKKLKLIFSKSFESVLLSIMKKRFNINDIKDIYKEVFLNYKKFILKCFKIIYNIQVIESYYIKVSDITNSYEQKLQYCIIYGKENIYNLNERKTLNQTIIISIFSLIKEILINLRYFKNIIKQQFLLYDSNNIEYGNIYKFLYEIISIILYENKDYKQLYTFILSNYIKLKSLRCDKDKKNYLQILFDNTLDNECIYNYVCNIIVVEVNNIFNKNYIRSDTKKLVKRLIGACHEEISTIVIMKYLLNLVNISNM